MLAAAAAGTSKVNDISSSSSSSTVGVEPWFTVTLVVLSTAAVVFAVVVFTVCFCRRRDLRHDKPAYSSRPSLHHAPFHSHCCTEHMRRQKLKLGGAD